MEYLDYFLQLKCSGDVMNSVNPIIKPSKEISESMAIVKKIKKILVCNPDKYTIFDLCAGNCLTSSLIAHLFKIKYVFAIDKANREREGFKKIRNFSYVKMDILKNQEYLSLMIEHYKPSIIISVHPCCDLAREIIQIYKESRAEYLIMMPCCHGKLSEKYPTFIEDKLSKYELWCLDLCKMMDGKGNEDKKCKSEKNIVIMSSRLNEIVKEVV
jgi:hypothetical protein